VASILAKIFTHTDSYLIFALVEDLLEVWQLAHGIQGFDVPAERHMMQQSEIFQPDLLQVLSRRQPRQHLLHLPVLPHLVGVEYPL